MNSGVPNWANRSLFWGDNLTVLRGMNSASVDVIATDPPFNKGKDFHATPDSLSSGSSFQDRWSWRDDVDQEWIDQITDDFPLVMNVINGSRNSYGDDMGAFLCFMAVRLLAMKRVLKKEGSIFLHCDPTASHYLKELMDAVFGKENFRNQIIWRYSGWNKKLRNHFERRHDVILFYTKSKEAKFHGYGTPWKSKEEYLKVRKQKLRVDEDGREYVLSDRGGGERIKRYIEEAMQYGRPTDDVWELDKLNNSSKEWLGYPTQKPLELYERLISSVSDEGDIVLDPFCGCATTLVAAEKLKRQWVGIDIWKGAPKAVIARLQELGLVDDKNGNSNYLFDSGEFFFREDVPARTDDSETVTPFLAVKQKVVEPDGKKQSRAEIYEILLSERGIVCQGCDRRFDDRRYLELDHNTPRSDGGLNHVSNRVLLCSPCNRAKSNHLTLSGLRMLNKKNGWMANQ